MYWAQLINEEEQWLDVGSYQTVLQESMCSDEDRQVAQCSLGKAVKRTSFILVSCNLDDSQWTLVLVGIQKSG